MSEPRWLQTSWVGALLLTAALAPTGSSFAAVKKNADALQPTSANYEGTLTPVSSGIAKAIAGNTVVIIQPWVGRKKYELRESPVYFRHDGKADSPDWVDVPWVVRGTEICLYAAASYCYTAYTDSKGQAFIGATGSDLIGRVGSIEPGDSRGIKMAYAARQAQAQAKTAMQMAFLGLLFEGMTHSGASSASPSDSLFEKEMARKRNDEIICSMGGSC